MSDGQMNALQKLFTGLVSPATAAAMEAESRSWMLRCPHCGYERSSWDAGGIRYKYKAAGSPRQYRKCPHCGQSGWHIIYRREGTPGTPATAATPLSTSVPIMRWVLFLSLLVALVMAFVLGLVLLLSTLTQPVVNAGNGFMSALKAGNYDQAYALCTPDLQRQVGGIPEMKTLVAETRPTRWSWGSRSIQNDVGRLDGSFSYPDGRTGSVHLALSRVGSDWRVSSFRLSTS